MAPNVPDVDGLAPLTNGAPPRFHLHRRGCCGLPAVRHVKHAPSYQVVPLISKGYRVGYNLRQCIVSLFTLHNESMNVWSHLLGALYVCYVLSEFLTGRRALYPMHAGEHIALITFLGCALTCLTTSTLYHLLGPSSEHVYMFLLKADMVGIALLIYGSYVPGIYYAFYCFPRWRGIYETVTLINLIMGMGGAIFTDLNCPKQTGWRTNTFASLVGFGLVPSLHWCFMVPTSVMFMFADNLAGMFLFYGLGFLFYVTRFPESMWPNRFDLWGASHQLWHICIVLAVVMWTHGIFEYHHVLHEQGCHIFDAQ